MSRGARPHLDALLTTTERPPIAPVPAAEPRPFWSVIVPTRDREIYLRETLESLLVQAPKPDEMQIEVVDNCSSKVDVPAVLREVAGDRVGYFRQPKPATISENWTTCIRRAKGHWVHLLHDDDVLEPGFYEAYRAFIAREPEVVLLACQARQIDEQGRPGRLRFNPPGIERTGILDDARRRIAEGDWIAPPSVVARRSAYEQIGGFLGFSHVLDWEMWMRLAEVGPVGYIHRPLLRNRRHGSSVTVKSFRTGRHIAEIVALIEDAVERLPAGQRVAVRRTARAEYARYAESMSRALRSQREYRAAVRHAILAWRLDPRGAVRRRIVGCLPVAVRSWAGRLRPGDRA